jgi:hypothetical protein
MKITITRFEHGYPHYLLVSGGVRVTFNRVEKLRSHRIYLWFGGIVKGSISESHAAEFTEAYNGVGGKL